MTTGSGTFTQNTTTVRLRILATSDLHMNVQAFDYVTDTCLPRGGLARLAPVIAKARQQADCENRLTLLLDNGDTLQGNALGDLLARTPAHPNPLVQAMNALRYDAVGLGNHDFDHGLDYLAGALQAFEMPVISTNVECDALPDLKNAAILSREVQTSDACAVTLNIGILSVLPPQTAAWNQNHLDGRADVKDALGTLRARVPELRDAGADIVIVLAHMGIAQSEDPVDQQAAALEVAQIAGVDAVVAGHTHLRFPDANHPQLEEIDPAAGTLAGVPAALPGVGGTDLAVIDLTLERANTWAVTDYAVELRRPEASAPEDHCITSLSAPAHRATRTYLSQPVGSIKKGMHTYFALADPSPVIALVAFAKKHIVSRLIQGTELEGLPLLAAASSPASGGLSGPDHYVDLPQGVVQRRHIAGLSPYANQIWAVRVKAQQLVRWLERSAEVFQVLRPDTPDQLLLDPAVPGFQYDTIFGLTYGIDPTSPPAKQASDASGQGRIRDVRWDGRPVTPDMEFLVATSHFRASGGGGFEDIMKDAIAVQSDVMLGEALAEYLETPECEVLRSSRPWHFCPDLGVQTILETSPNALQHLDGVAHLKPEPIGTTSSGFARVRLHL